MNQCELHLSKSYDYSEPVETESNNAVNQTAQSNQALTTNSILSANADYATDEPATDTSSDTSHSIFNGDQNLFTFSYQNGTDQVSLQWNGFGDTPTFMYYDSTDNQILTQADSLQEVMAQMPQAVLKEFKAYLDKVSSSTPTTPTDQTPEEPVEPTPTEPTQPEDPIEPTPTEPTEPTQPEDPVEPTPTDPAQPEGPDDSTPSTPGSSPVEPGPKTYTTQWGETKSVNYEDLDATGIDQLNNWGSAEGKDMQSWVEGQYDKFGVPKNFWIDSTPNNANGFGGKVVGAMQVIADQGNQITAKNGEKISYTDMIDMMKQVGNHWNIPWEMLLAMSVQESNIGTVTSNGAGCGILQVEKGTGAYDIFERPWLKEALFSDPKVKELLGQAGITMDSKPEDLAQVPDEIWDNPYLSMNMACAFLTRTLEQQEGTPSIGKGMDAMFNMVARYNNSVPSNVQTASGEKSLKGQTYASYVMAHLAYILQNKEAMANGTLIGGTSSGSDSSTTVPSGPSGDTQTPTTDPTTPSTTPSTGTTDPTDANNNPYSGVDPVSINTPDAAVLQKIQNFTWEKNASDYRDPGSANDVSKIVGQALDLPPEVLFGLIMAESWGSPTPGNADGLMQVQEPTWNQTIALHKADLEKLGVPNPQRTDPMSQVIVGSLYLKDMIAAAEAKGWQGEDALWVGVGKYNAGPDWDPGETAGQDIYGRQINAEAHIQKVKTHAANYIDPDTGQEGY